MGQKDLWQSDYFDSNVRFADAYNGIFFNGKEIIKPFVNDYKLNFYDYHNQTDFSNFKTENKLLFEVLANVADKGKVQQLFLEEAENYSLDREAAAALIGMAGMPDTKMA